MIIPTRQHVVVECHDLHELKCDDKWDRKIGYCSSHTDSKNINKNEEQKETIQYSSIHWKKGSLGSRGSVTWKSRPSGDCSAYE